MRNLFSKQMEQLHVELIEMGALCEQAISRAYQVLMEEDPKAAQNCEKRMRRLIPRREKSRVSV